MQLQRQHCLLRDPCLTRLDVQTWDVWARSQKRSSICQWWQEWIPDIWHCKIILLELPFELREKYGNVFLRGRVWGKAQNLSLHGPAWPAAVLLLWITAATSYDFCLRPSVPHQLWFASATAWRRLKVADVECGRCHSFWLLLLSLSF